MKNTQKDDIRTDIVYIMHRGDGKYAQTFNTLILAAERLVLINKRTCYMKNLSEAGDGDEPDSTYEEPIEEPLPSGCQHRLHPSTTPLKTCPSKREALFFHSHHLYWPFFSTYGGLACLNSAIRPSPQHPIASITIHHHLHLTVFSPSGFLVM